MNRVQFQLEENDLFQAAFGQAGDAFPLATDGSVFTCDDIFEYGPSGAANALLAVALTENLSAASCTTLLQFYNALNPRPKRGDFKLTVSRRHPGRKPKSLIKDIGEGLNAAIIAKLVEFAFKDFGQMEAAVADVCRAKKMSRASVYRALARAKSDLSQEN